MEDVAEREAEAERLEAEMAEACGVLHAATARLVALIGRVLETEAWQGFGIRSPQQWVAWKCGVSPHRAHTLVAMARRLGALPETRAAFDAGELGEDSVGLICRLAPTAVDADVAELARNTTVTQLRRVLKEYTPQEDPAEEPAPVEEKRSVSFNHTDTGTWRLSAELPPDEGAVWEKALTQARDELFRAGEAGPGPGASPADVSWADAFVAIAEKSLAAEAVAHPHRDRSMVLLHVGTQGGHLHLGPGLNEGLARYIGCDSRVRAVFEADGRPVSVGRAFRTVPDRTRMVVEDRDRGCRVPGCDRRRWLHVHHLRAWQDGAHRHAQPDLPLPASPSPAPPGEAGHRGQWRRPKRSDLHRRSGATTGELRQTDASGQRLTATGQLGTTQRRTPRPLGDLLQRGGAGVRVTRSAARTRPALQLSGS